MNYYSSTDIRGPSEFPNSVVLLHFNTFSFIREIFFPENMILLVKMCGKKFSNFWKNNNAHKLHAAQ